RFIMPTALCCPSRASFLTGKYAHHTGLRTNNDQLLGPTFVNRLHDAGYFTGLVGKTIYELAGIPIPSDIDGRSLVPLLRGSTEWREAVPARGLAWHNERANNAERRRRRAGSRSSRESCCAESGH